MIKRNVKEIHISFTYQETFSERWGIGCLCNRGVRFFGDQEKEV